MFNQYQIFSFGFLFLLGTMVNPVHAAGGWMGQDTLHVPLSWCVVQGSPAEDNPDVNGDTDTDAVIWRRHERPTDNIYINATGITFRSAINDVWGTLNFPIIDDPDTSLGIEGDMRGEASATGGLADSTEFTDLVNNCDTAWEDLGRAGIGVTAVNVGLLHDVNGDYVRTIGWGGCNESTPGTCSSPFDGRIAVIDNHYKHPSVPDRSWPDGSTSLFTPDPLDQLVAHELGHALSLDHRSNDMAMMNPGQRDNSGDGNVDNITINNTEQGDLRSNAAEVPGLETDPPGQFNPGRFLATRIVDRTPRNKNIRKHLDITSVRATLDKTLGEMTIGTHLYGLIPRDEEMLDYWFFVDSDGVANGIHAKLRAEIEAPGTKFEGADFIARITVFGGKVVVKGWHLQGEKLVAFDRYIHPELQSLVMHPHFDPAPKEPVAGVAVNHTVVMRIHNKLVDIKADQPFRVHVLTARAEGKVMDELVNREKQPGADFILEDPSFPHCYPQDVGVPGETVKVVIEKLRPNAPIHGLLGPDLVFKGKTDDQAGGSIDFPIPNDTATGFHLITVGVDDTALTADCVVEVRKRR